MLRARAAAAAVVLTALIAPSLSAAVETPGRDTQLYGNGRLLQPVGRQTDVGTFPTGGALSPDGRFYWTVDAGRGADAVRIVDVGSGAVLQTLPIPGGYVGIAFAPDGRRAYVSGEPAEGDAKGLKGAGGDVVHVFDVDTKTGKATEADPLALPNARDGAAANDELPPASGVAAWPEGLAVSHDGRRLVVALGQADQVAIFDLTKKGADASLADVGRYPYGVVTDPRRPRAYVTNERDGTVSAVDLDSGKVVATIDVGGAYAHAEGITADPLRDRIYVAVTDRDQVTAIDTASLKVARTVDLRRDGVFGVAPVSPAVSPDGDTLYVADAGEDAVAAIALEQRPASTPKPRTIIAVRSTSAIAKYRRGVASARAHRRHTTVTAYKKRLAKLRRQYLRGTHDRACGGPTRTQDRAWGKAILRALDRLSRDLHHGLSRTKAKTGYARRVDAARRKLTPVMHCPRPGFVRSAKPFTVLGRLPTAAYPTDVEVTPDGGRLIWLAAKGYGTGPNTGADHDISRLQKGKVGVLDRPTDQGMAALTKRADKQITPTNHVGAPAGTPIVGPGGGPSDKIKYVFYVVKENRTYDQIFGSEPRGRGDPRLEVFDDNGVPGPTGGVTPNAHALARTFPLLDNVYANSEESTTGHKITAGGYANDYTERFTNISRGKKGNPDIFAMGIPPGGFVFDQAVRQNVPFRVYGELGAGNQPFANDGRPTFSQVVANTDYTYPSQVSGTCSPFNQDVPAPNSVRCTSDAGEVSTEAGKITTAAPAAQSRIRSFQTEFQAQIAAGTVPSFNYLILFNDHTNGTTPGDYTPKANVADNDLALGQLVELVSHSSIWSQSAIFVMEDDSQDGIDSVDAHRIPAFVISPWARRGAVVSTRYDHYSFLRTAELIAGLKPLSINDAMATPLYEAFISGDEKPDVDGTRYTAIQPQQSLTEVNTAASPDARLSAALPWEETDVVPQRLSDRIIWESVFGAGSTPPKPGPNWSSIERARTVGALRAFRRSPTLVRKFLSGGAEEEDGPRALTTAGLLAFGTGITPAEAKERLDRIEGEHEAKDESSDRGRGGGRSRGDRGDDHGD